MVCLAVVVVVVVVELVPPCGIFRRVFCLRRFDLISLTKLSLHWVVWIYFGSFAVAQSMKDLSFSVAPAYIQNISK